MTSSDDIRIDPAKETDLPFIRPLLAELMGAMIDTEGFDIEQSVENCRLLIRDPAQYVFVARQRDNVIGFINFSTRRTVMHPGPSALIDELVVSENHRATGIGKQLILAAVNKCRELGCCELEVSTEKSNTGARRFYKACGFDEDAVLLDLDLAETNGEQH